MNQQRSSQPLHSIIRAPAGLLAGATYPFRALAVLLKTPQLWGYVLVPVLVNLMVGIALYLGLLLPSLKGIDALIADWSVRFDAFVASFPTWLSFLSFLDNGLAWLVRILLVAGLLLTIGFLLVQFGVVLGAPWYGQLSEQLELRRIGQLPQVEMSLGGIVTETGRAIAYELRKLQLLVSVGLPLLLLNFVPTVGSVVAGVGGVALGAMLVGLDFMSAPLDRRRLNFQQKLAAFRESLPASASFGLVCFGLVSIPLLNLLAIPLCMAAGTLFFCDRIWPVQFAEAEKLDPQGTLTSPRE